MGYSMHIGTHQFFFFFFTHFRFLIHKKLPHYLILNSIEVENDTVMDL